MCMIFFHFLPHSFHLDHCGALPWFLNKVQSMIVCTYSMCDESNDMVIGAQCILKDFLFEI